MTRIRTALQSEDIASAALLYLQRRGQLEGQLDARELELIAHWLESNGMEHSARIPRSAGQQQKQQ